MKDEVNGYDLLLFGHVLGAIAWVGIGVIGQALLVIADRKGEWPFVADLNRAFGWIEAPAAVLGPFLLLGTGIGMVLAGPWRFTDTWVVIGLTGIALALVLGAAVQGPGLKRFQQLVKERGPADPATKAAARRLNDFMWPELAIVLIVLLAMVAKPTGGGTLGFWLGAAIIVAVAAGLFASDRAARR